MTVLEQSLGVGVAGQGGACPAGQRRGHGQRHGQIRGQQTQGTTTVVVDRDAGHQPVEREHAGVVGHDQPRALVRDVVRPDHLDPEPVLEQRAPQGQPDVGVEVFVEAELVDLVAAGDAGRQDLPGGVDGLGHPGQRADVAGREHHVHAAREIADRREHLDIDRHGLHDLPEGGPHRAEEPVDDPPDLGGGGVAAGGRAEEALPDHPVTPGVPAALTPAGAAEWLAQIEFRALHNASSMRSGRAPIASSSPMVVSTPARSRSATGPGSNFSSLATLRSSEARVTSGSVPESTR